MIENQISGYLHNEPVSESNEEKCTFKIWLGPLSFIKILVKTAQLLSRHFLSGLSVFILYFFFHKGKDTSAIPQPSVQNPVYVFPIFFRFQKCFNNFHSSKNILINKFFHWNMCFFTVLRSWCKGVVSFSLKKNNLMRLKTKHFLFILTDNHTKIREIIFSAIKNDRLHLCD